MSKLVTASKPQTPQSLRLTQAFINQNSACFNPDKAILMLILVIQNHSSIIKNGFAQNTAVFPKNMIFKNQIKLRLDNGLYGDSAWLTLQKSWIIFHENFPRNGLDCSYPNLWNRQDGSLP